MKSDYSDAMSYLEDFYRQKAQLERSAQARGAGLKAADLWDARAVAIIMSLQYQSPKPPPPGDPDFAFLFVAPPPPLPPGGTSLKAR